VKLKVILRVIALALVLSSLLVGLAHARDDQRKPKQKDAQVLIAGGDSVFVPIPPNSGIFFSTAELYDSATGTFSRTLGNMNVDRHESEATRLSDGRVLITGGQFDGTDQVAGPEIYDPTTQSFTLSQNFVAFIAEDNVLELLKTGKVLIAGGDGFGLHLPVFDSAQLFDPKTNSYMATGSMSLPRFSSQSTILANGKVLVAGGIALTQVPPGASPLCFEGVCEVTDLAELYDPKTGTFKLTGPMLVATAGGTATLLNNGTVLVAGGETTLTAGTNAAELYDPKRGTFSATGSMVVAREGGFCCGSGVSFTATLLKDGRVLFAGGADATSPFGSLDSAELYNPKTGTFSLTDHMTTARSRHDAVLLPNGDVLIAGGDATGNPSAELYDPQEGRFRRTGDMTTARFGATATLLGQ
jgi:hypothetical protein